MDAEPYFWLQPLVTGLGALAVLLGAGLTVRQRYRADRKEQWWVRTQWGLDLVVSGDEDKLVLGLEVLAQQAVAHVADREDAAFIDQVLTPVTDDYLRVLDGPSERGDNDHDTDPGGADHG